MDTLLLPNERTHMSQRRRNQSVSHSLSQRGTMSLIELPWTAQKGKIVTKGHHLADNDTCRRVTMSTIAVQAMGSSKYVAGRNKNTKKSLFLEN